MNIFQSIKSSLGGYVPMVRTLPEDFEVTIVEGEDGWSSSPEPSLDSLRDADPDFSNLDHLIWHAAVVSARTGLKVSVSEGFSSTNDIRDKEFYAINVPGCGTGAHGFNEAWTLITGIEIGAKAILRRRDRNDTITD